MGTCGAGGAARATTNRAQFEPFLALNHKAVEQVTGRPVREYSAPEGNQPQWSTAWLEGQGIVAYCSTGNTGLGPTRTYWRGQPIARKMWAFPVLTYGALATFEELHNQRVPEAELVAWLQAVADFAAEQRVVRMLYFHPEGAVLYPRAMQELLERAALHRGRGRLRWHTMPAVADFLNIREQVSWKLLQPEPAQHLLDAAHPMTLARQTWLAPKTRYARPRLLMGDAGIHGDGSYWVITARSGKRLRILLPLATTVAPAQILAEVANAQR